MENTKMTKAMYFARIREIVEAVDSADQNEILEFVDKQIAQLESKAEKAKEKASEKRAVGDELREVVYSVLSAEAQTIDEIVSHIEGEDITRAKITSRLSQLVKAEKVVKEVVKVDGRKVCAYRLA